MIVPLLILLVATPSPAPPPDASATARGLVSTQAQPFAGTKTFNDGAVIDKLHARVPHTQTVLNAAGTIAITGSRMHVTPPSGLTKLTSTPSVTAGTVAGQHVQVVNVGTGLLQLQDKRQLTGSALKLRSRQITLSTGQEVELVWDGSNWVELARSTRGTPARLHVEDYGAIGDGSTNDGPAIQHALDDAYAQHLPLDFDGLTYVTNQELSNQGVELQGSTGGGTTIIQAGASIRSIMAVTGRTRVRQIEFWGVFLASNAIWSDGTSYSRYEGVRAYETLVDGWHQADGAGNDSVLIIDSGAELCGTIYRTSSFSTSSGAHKVTLSGTISTTLSSATYTGSGTNWNTSLKPYVRSGDFLAVGSDASSAQWLMILSVDSDTQITGYGLNAASASVSGSQYAVFVGDGYHEEPSGDANNAEITHFHTINTAGSALVFAGLYGPRVSQLQADACGAFPVRVGLISAAAPQVSDFNGLYVESFTSIAPGVIFVGDANGLMVRAVKSGVAPTYIPNPSLASGGLLMNNQIDAAVFVKPLGDTTDLVPSRFIDASNSDIHDEGTTQVKFYSNPSSPTTLRVIVKQGNTVYANNLTMTQIYP